MKNRFAVLAAAVIAVGGMSIASASFGADDTPNTGGNTTSAGRAADRAGDAANRAADKTGDALNHAADKTGNAIDRASDRVNDATTGDRNLAKAPDAKDIKDTLATATEAAVTKGGFDDLVERFVDHDRDRLSKFANQKFDDLDGRIAQLQKDWKEKYGQDFKFEHSANDVLNEQFAKITQGEIPGEGHARTAGEKIEGAAEKTKDAVTPGHGAETHAGPNGGTVYEPKDKNANSNNNNNATGSNQGTNAQGPGGQADLEKAGATQKDANSNKIAGGDTNREPGRNVAAVVIPASHGMPEVAVPMIHEFPDKWKIDAPDDVDGQKLHDSLLKHLTMFDQDKANWPGDVNEAYRMATHHVLAAIFEGQSGAPKAAGDTQQPGSGM